MVLSIEIGAGSHVLFCTVIVGCDDAAGKITAGCARRRRRRVADGDVVLDANGLQQRRMMRLRLLLVLLLHQ